MNLRAGLILRVPLFFALLELDEHVSEFGEDASFTLPVAVVPPEILYRRACIETSRKFLRGEDLVGCQLPPDVFCLGLLKALFVEECKEVSWDRCHGDRPNERVGFAPGQKVVRRSCRPSRFELKAIHVQTRVF